MRLFSSYLVGSLALAMLSGCVCSDNRKHDTKKDSDKDDQSKQSSLFAPVGGEASKSTDQNITKAVAVINPLVDNSVKGKVTFTKVEGGVLIVADLDGLKPGEHGFHVHEYGDCGKAGMAAGAHFNPNNGKHGGPDSPDRHVGDLGNIVADAKGHAHYERVDKLIKLEGRNSIVGRSIIIHADKDDYVSQPAGASGAKIACGIIQAVSD